MPLCGAEAPPGSLTGSSGLARGQVLPPRVKEPQGGCPGLESLLSTSSLLPTVGGQPAGSCPPCAVPRPSPSTLAIPEGSSGQGATPLGHTDSWEWGDKWGTQRGEQAGWHPGLMWRAPRTGRRGGLSGPLQVSPVRQAHGRVPAPPLT